MSCEGSCHCGAIRYALSAPPQQSMICHCKTCRGVSGAPVVAWLTVDPGAFKITKGKPARYKSSANVERQFCGACGAQLTYARTDDASYVDVATATLDDPDAFPPTHHSWLSHDIAWIKFGDGLPAFRKSRGDGESLSKAGGPSTCEGAETGLACTNASGNRSVLSRERVAANSTAPLSLAYRLR